MLTGPHLLERSSHYFQITAPASNTVVQEGQSVTITVVADPSVQNVYVIGDSALPNVQITSTPNQFTLTLPTNVPAGVYSLSAVGNNSSGLVMSTPVAIDIEPQTLPEMTVSPIVLSLALIGDKHPLRVIGTLSSGSIIDLTRSTLLSYGSNNTQIATVDSSGMVTAAGPGQTYITVSASAGVHAAMMVTVPQQPPNGNGADYHH